MPSVIPAVSSKQKSTIYKRFQQKWLQWPAKTDHQYQSFSTKLQPATTSSPFPGLIRHRQRWWIKYLGILRLVHVRINKNIFKLSLINFKVDKMVHCFNSREILQSEQLATATDIANLQSQNLRSGSDWLKFIWYALLWGKKSPFGQHVLCTKPHFLRSCFKGGYVNCNNQFIILICL